MHHIDGNTSNNAPANLIRTAARGPSPSSWPNAPVEAEDSRPPLLIRGGHEIAGTAFMGGETMLSVDGRASSMISDSNYTPRSFDVTPDTRREVEAYMSAQAEQAPADICAPQAPSEQPHIAAEFDARGDATTQNADELLEKAIVNSKAARKALSAFIRGLMDLFGKCSIEHDLGAYLSMAQVTYNQQLGEYEVLLDENKEKCTVDADVIVYECRQQAHEADRRRQRIRHDRVVTITSEPGEETFVRGHQIDAEHERERNDK